MVPTFKKIYYSISNDPYENLALENHLLLNLGPEERALLVYVNRPSIVMGRFQNPWIESNLDVLKKNNIDLVRRQSGGGCVYHDLGNLNFCFLHGNRDYFKHENNEFLIHFLNEFEIPAIVNERSDIVLDIAGDIFKFSGSAFKQKKDRSFHHCTMLIDSNVSMLTSILDSPLKSLKSKSTRSKPVPVKNLIEVVQNLSVDKVITALKQYAQDFSIIDYQGEESEYLQKLLSWKWKFGETPLFTIELQINKQSLSLEIRKGIVIAAVSESSAFESLCLRLKDMPLENYFEIRESLEDVEFGLETLSALRKLYLVGDTSSTAT